MGGSISVNIYIHRWFSGFFLFVILVDVNDPDLSGTEGTVPVEFLVKPNP